MSHRRLVIIMKVSIIIAIVVYTCWVHGVDDWESDHRSGSTISNSSSTDISELEACSITVRSYVFAEMEVRH